jgi:hypothetical protein
LEEMEEMEAMVEMEEMAVCLAIYLPHLSANY